MNKIFKVVWSKTKECYVVVSEVAKNNGGKKKVLASVLAGLAMAGIGASGTPVLASYDDSGSKINIAPNAKTGNYVGTNSVVVGYENATDAAAGNLGRIIYGTANIAAGDSTLALGNSNEARGTAVVAVGHGSAAKAKQSVAIGNVARAEKDGTVAIGTYVNAETANVGTADKPKYNTKETGVYSTAVGAFSWSKGDYSAAYGYQAEATGTNAVAIGRVSKATGTSATALGVNNKAQADDSSAVGSSNTIAATATQASAFGRENQINLAGSLAAGYKNTTNGERNVAVGSENTTTGEDSIGIGTKVIAGTGKTIAIGSVATNDGTTLQTIARGNDTINKATGQVNNIFALAIGNGAQADGKAKSASGMIAIGQEVKADNNNTIAIGVKTEATGNNGTAIGGYAQAIGASSAAFGTQAVANGLGATAFGPGASAGTGDADGEAEGAVAIGRKASVAKAASGAAAIGWASEATKADATAIGHSATANIAGGVALGSESKTTVAAGVQGYNPASDRTDKYSTQAGAVGTSTLAAVSIGDGSAKTRQLTGLAAGTADTDAVNVAQLKNVNLKYAGDTGNSDVLLKDHTLNVKGSDFITTSADGTGITVKAKIGDAINANAAGKAVAPTTNGLATTTNVADAINASGWNVVSSNNGGSVTGTQATKLVNPGSKVTLSAGKNIVLDQNDKQFTYSLNKDVDLTKDGSLTIGDTKITNAGMTITGGPSITKTGIDAGSKKITNVTAGTADTDAVNVKQLKDTEKHIKPGTYAVANDGSVTLKYVDGNGAEQTETAKITGIAKKSKVINGQNTTVEEGTDTTDNSVTYKVNVKGDLADISSITNGTGSGKISFEGDQVVKVGGDHPISFDGKGGYVTGLQNKDWNITNPTVVSGRAATEDQLKKVSDGFNNTVKLTGNSGATGTQKLNQNGGLSFGVVGADNGKYITTTASGSNVVADLSDDAKAKLEHKVVVEAGSKNVTVATDTTDPSKTVYKVSVANTPAGAASTESVVKKAVTGDTNIADITVAGGKATGDADAQYEVNVSRNVVKDAAREAVTINNGGTTTGGTYTADTNNPITVNPVKDDTNHNTTYEVKFDGNKAAKVIPLTYKANGNGAKTVTLEKGLDFTNGTNTTAEIDNEGVVKYNLNKDVDLSNAGSLTVGGTTVNNGGITIKAPTTPGTTTTDVKLTNTGLDNGGNKIVNVAEGKADTDAVNVKQLKDAKTKLEDGENTTVEGDGTTATPYKVNVKGDLANISSITNGAGSGKISFGNDQVVTVNGDHPISLNGKTGDITGLTNTTIPTAAGSDFATKGRAATEEQLKVVNDKFNNKINLGADTNETTKFQLDNAGGIKFNIKGDGSGTGGANQYISTTANGSNVNVDLTADAKAKLNKTYTVSSGSTNVTVTPTTVGDNTDFKITVANTGSTTSSSWNLNSGVVSATEGTHAGDTTQNIADTKTVTMQAGKNLTVTQTNDTAGNASVAYSLDKDISVETVTVTGQNGKDGKIGINGKDGVDGKDGKNRVEITVEKGAKGVDGTDGHDGVNGHNGKDGMTRIVYEDKGGKQEVATLNDGLKFTGNNESTENKHKLNTLVKVQGEGTKEGTDATGTKEIQTSDGTKFESAKDNIAVEANGADTLTVKLNKNLKGLDSVTTKEIKLGDANDNISIKKDGDRITYTTNNGGTTTTNKVANLADEKHITQGNYTVGDKTIDTNAADDEVTLTYTDGNGDLVKDTANSPIMTKIKGIAKSDLSNINDAGKKVITGLGTIVKAGDNVTVTSTSDTKTGQTTYTVNAVTPAVYTKADGTKVVKRPDGTFTTNVDGAPGNDVPASDVIVSFQDAAGNRTGGNSIVNNVGSAIDKTGTSTGDTFLTKLDNAATNTPNAAVNVKDLKNTSDAIIGKGLKFDANEGGEKTNKLGSKVTVQGSGALTAGKAYADEYNTANIRTNIEQGTDGNTTINVGLAKALKDINSISNGSSSITISDVPAGATTPAVTISGGNLSMGDGTTNNKIVNLAPGTDGTDAVNLNQLKGMRTVVTSTDKSVTVTSNENSTTGQVTYDLKVSTTGTVAKSTWNLNSGVVSATEGTHAGDTTQNIADTKTVTMQAGKNLTVTQTNDTAGNASVAYSLDKDISVETVTVTGQNGKDGKIGIDGKDGVDGKDGKNRVEITVEKGAKGVDGTDGHDGVNGHNGKDGMTRIVYEDKGGKQEVATLNDGLKFTGNNESTENNHKLNTLVKVQGEGTKEGTDAAGTKEIQTSDGTKFESAADNIAVEADGIDKLTVKLNKNLKGLDSVTTKEIKLGDANDNISIKKDGDRITYTTNNGGTTTTNKVANLADEKHITQGNYTVGDKTIDTNAADDEVTLTYTNGNGDVVKDTSNNPIMTKIKGIAKSDLSNINDAGKKVITGLGTIVKAGDNVTVTSTSDTKTGQTTYTVNAVTPAVYTKADGTKVVKRPDGTFTTNVDGAPGNDVPASDVIVSFQDAAGNRTGGNSIVNNVGSAIDKPGTATGNTFLTKLDNAATNTPFAAVNVRDLKTTADALKANELHIAPTSGGTDTDKGGVVKTAGSTDMVYKYDSASKTITLTYNDGNGKAVTGPKAVLDFTDLNIPAGGNNFGFKANATANGGTVANDATTPAAATAVENGGTVNFAAGKNLTVKQDIDATNKTQTYTFSLDKDLTNLDKVVVNGKDGIAGKDGVTIVGPQGATGAPGIPGTNGIDGKVGISGKDGKDAVSIAGKDGVGTIGLTGPQGPAGTNGKSVDISTENGKQTLVKPEANNGNQSQRIVYVPKDANGNPLKDADGNDIKREVATMDDGLRFTGNNTSKENKQPMNSLVKVQGEGVTENAAGKLEANGQELKSAAGNIAVEADGQNTLTVKMNKDLNLTKDGSVTMGDTVVNNDGITIKAPTTPGTTTTDVKLTNQGLDNGGNKITNVAAGTANTDAVNVKQLKDNVTTVTSSDSSIKVVDKNDPTSATYDATKGHQYDITVNNQGVVNNAQTPVVYTKEDGTKVYKQPNGTFTTNIDGTGTVVPANQVIASMNSAGNSSTDPTKLQNVGSSIADKTGTTFLDKINTAAADPNAKYGAVNVTDLKSTSDALIDKGLVFDANNGDPKTNKLGSKVTIAGTGALGTTENFTDKYNTDNIRTNITQDPTTGNTTVEIGLNKNLKGLESVSVPGKDGVDGQDGVSITGKDGANGVDGKVSIGKDGKDAVSISGKDGIGHIGLTGPAGKDGKNATADITVKEGQPGLNGTDGITRIVYKDKDGNDHEVATHDDGVKYAGDDAQGTDKTKVISKKLNQTIDIVGGADKTKLTDNNIGVNNDGGKLKVQLANELGGINKISNGGSSITFNSNPGGATNTPAVQISGGDLNMGGNKITNLKKGTAASDAATVGQLTKVKSSNNSVGITESTDANGAKVYDLSVTGVPGADPRVDKLGEEIGRVGAQGAALAALKPIQYDPLEPTQIMAGYGNYRGNSAVALGVAHYKNESTLIHGGVSWAGGSSHMMANAGVTWKVGNRDSEAAVADRYRKGPISSTYAMQQEMAAMKAQNAGLKGEVSDLKAENEQMKAQIAAMMAKLGL
ncbi:ESPR-type extended signal peptide-containing protein [Veillonella tobetsuensis]|uniref:Hep/Hag repeat protein n=1 Tax=Veillonella tobetsuensis TaxID=1110546 RepID=A0A2S7ZP46_9FIRM|nr:ESPR-type extended signal peptide-containing protein [Veillonella tobetsuensis]PQL25048.1 hypothetical protein VTHSUH11_05910 [Veillonella tobetsuensis]